MTQKSGSGIFSRDNVSHLGHLAYGLYFAVTNREVEFNHGNDVYNNLEWKSEWKLGLIDRGDRGCLYYNNNNNKKYHRRKLSR